MIPQLDKNARYTYVDAEFVDTKTNKTIARDKSGEYTGVLAGWDVRFNDATKNVEVKSAGTDSFVKNAEGKYKDLGIKVIAATNNTGYGISGTTKLKVVNGIEDIDISAQPYIVKQAGKPASFKVSVELNNSNSNKAYAPKSKIVAYEIVSAATRYDLSNKAAGPAGVTIDPKNGTVKIDKDYVVSKVKAQNQFKVLAKAADYAGNTEYNLTSNVIEITDKPLSMGGLAIMKKGEKGGWSKATIVPDSQLPVTKITDSTSEDKIEETAEYRAVVLQSNVAADRASYDLNDFDIVVDPAGLNFTPAKGNIYVNPDGYIVVSKLGKATIVATDKNDKKNKKDRKLEFVQKNTKMELQITQYLDSTFSQKATPVYETNVPFQGGNTTYFALNVVERDKKGVPTTIDLSDVKLSFKKNVKNITPKKDADWSVLSTNFNTKGNRPQYVIAVTGDQGTVSFKSKTQGDADYVLVNGSFKSEKAPKLTPVDKKQKIITDRWNSLSYVVTSANKDEKSLAGKYVMLSLDSSKKNPKWAADALEGYLDRVIPIKDGSVIDFEIYPYEAGSYNLNVAVGSLVEGDFTHDYADAKLSIKVAKKGSVNLKVNGKYTLDPQIASKVEIDYNKKDASAWFVNTPVYDKDSKADNYAMNAIIDNVENHFRDYFIAEAYYDKYGTPYIGTIGLRDGVSATKLAELVNAKSNDLIGYISVSNGDKQMDVKITMGYKQVKSLKAANASIISGSDMTLDIQLFDGKTYVPVKEDYEIVSTDGTNFDKDKDKKNWLANKIEIKDSNDKVVATAGDMRLKGADISDGKYKLTLKVAPLYATAKDTAKFTVEVPVTVLKSESAKNKVVFAKGMNNWVVTNRDYKAPAKGDPEQGVWATDLTYTFKNPLGIKNGTPINVAQDTKASYVSFVSDGYNVDSSQKLTVKIDKYMLEASVDGKKLKWGGKVTVKPTFTYGDDKNPTKLMSDSASITITLPNNLKGADTVKADIEAAEKDIQYIIDTMTAHYRKIAEKEEKPDYSGYNKDIALRVKERIVLAVNGAVVDVNVTPEGTRGQSLANKYTVEVKDNAAKTIYGKKDFTVNGDTTVSDVTEKISELSAGEWTELKKDAELAKLLTLTKDTTEGQYVTMLRSILNKEGTVKLTSNIGIFVKINEVKAPGKEDGSYDATVTVIDRNFAPGKVGYSDSVNIETTLNKLESADGAKTRLTKAMMDEDTIKEIVGGAWDSVATVGAEASEDNKVFYEAVEKSIEAKANELLAKGDKAHTGNTGLTAAVKEESLTFTVEEGKVTALTYKLILTEGDTETEVEIGKGETLEIAVEPLETPAGLLAKIKEEVKTIKKCAEGEVAEAVKTRIISLSKNKAYDTADVDVEVVEGTYVAPTADINGLVNVKVTLAKDVSDTIENLIIMAGDTEDFVIKGEDEMEKEELEAAKALERTKALITTDLSKETLQELVQGLVDAAVSKKEDIRKISQDDVLAAIAKEVGGDDGETGVLTDTGYILAPKTANDWKTSITLAKGKTITMPTGGSKTMTIPAFTISIKLEDAAADAKADEVSIAAHTLDAMPDFQTLTEAKAAIKATMNLDYMEALDDVDTTAKDFDANADATKKAIIDAVKDVLAGYVTNQSINLSVETSDYATAKVSLQGEDSENLFKITALKVTFKEGDSGTPESKSITVNIKKKESTDAVTAVRFTAVDDVEITYDGDGNPEKPEDNNTGVDSDNPVEITVGGETKDSAAIAFEVLTTEAGEENADTYHDEVELKVVSTKGDIEDIAFDPEELGKLNIPLPAHGDENHELLLKVTATSKGSGFDGKDVTNDLYVKLTFEPQVTDIEIDGPERIELDAEGTSEAIKYTAKATGIHLLETEETQLVWASEDLGDALKDGKDGSATVQITKNADLVGSKKLTVSTDKKTNEDLNELDKEMAVEIVQNNAEDSELPPIVLGTEGLTTVKTGTLASTEGQDEVEPTAKLTLTGKSVKIPLSVTTDDEVERTWTYGFKEENKDLKDVVKIEGSYLVIKEGIDEIKDEVPPTEEGGEYEGTADIPKFTLTATAAGSAKDGTADMVAGEYTFALVVERTVNGVKIMSTKDDGTALDDEDDGSGNLEASVNDTIYLKPELSGYHIKEADKSDATLKITFRSKGLAGAKIAKPAKAGGVWTVTLPETGTGYVEITATSGTGESAVTSKRLIKVSE